MHLCLLTGRKSKMRKKRHWSRKKKESQRDVALQRDISHISEILPNLLQGPLSPINNDLRRYNPTKKALTIEGKIPTKTLRKPKSGKKRRDMTRDRFGFRDPHVVDVCRRRRNRRIELFKSGKAGKGRKILGTRKKGRDSDIRC